MIRVLVVDDHPVVRHGLVSMLRWESDLEIVGEAADGEAAINEILASEPDVVLLDLHLPIRSGVEVMRHVRTVLPKVHFLVLTTYDTDSYISPALAAGAHGYLLKDAAPDELARAVRSVMQGGVTLEPAIAARVLERIDEDEIQELSTRERDVLQLLADGVTNRAIALRLGLSENTIKTYLSRIFSKLGVQSRAEAVSVALRRNIIPMRR